MARKTKKTIRKATKKTVARKKVAVFKKKKSFKTFAIAIACIAAWIVLVIVAVVFSVLKIDFFAITNESIPVMEISLENVTLDEVHKNGKDKKYDGNSVKVDGVEYKDVEFKGRGNFSWAADKKSYRLKLDSKVSFLNMKKTKKWALIANSVDNSLLRNDIAYYLTDMVVGDYPFRGKHINLRINGEDLGLYYLIQTMDIGKNAVDLHDPMGVLVELDNVYCEEEDKWYVTSDDNCLTLKAAVVDDNADVAMNEFVKDFDALEESIKKKDYKKVEELADVKSFAEYFVISEITANPDAYVTSWFMYKDGTEDKIHAGLTWDFDAAFGNREWGKDMCVDEFYLPTVETIHMGDGSLRSGGVKTSQMLYQFAEGSYFKRVVGEVYRERLKGRIDEIMDYIDAKEKEISIAAERDAKIWKKGNYKDDIDYLKQWIRERIQYFEKKYANYI